MYFEDSPSLLLDALIDAHIKGQKAGKWKDTQMTKTSYLTNGELRQDSLEIVVIIGESYIYSHSTLYGYPHMTTPRQQCEADSGNLIPFKYILTPSNHTIEAMQNICNLNRKSEGEEWTSSRYFPTIFHDAGWDVMLFDNNVQGNEPADLIMTDFMHDEDIARRCYTVSGRVYGSDFDMLKATKPLFTAGKSPNKLVIYHLFGEHNPFKNHNVHKFNAQDYVYRKEPWMTDGKRQVIADYDNGTLYNDSVVGAIFDRYRSRNAIVLYFSDHGEEAYDYRDSEGRMPVDDGMEREYYRAQYRVPFMVWMSPRYRQLYPDMILKLRTAANLKGSTEDVGYMLLHLGGIATTSYRAERDILSPKYHDVPRRTNENVPINL